MHVFRVSFIIVVLVVISKVNSTCLSDEELAEQNRFHKVLFTVGCTLHKGAQRVGQGVKNTYNFVRGRGGQNQNQMPATADSQPPTEPISRTPQPVNPTPPEFNLDVRSDFEGRSVQDTNAEMTSETIQNRMLFTVPIKCLDGQFLDHRNRCRSG